MNIIIIILDRVIIYLYFRFYRLFIYFTDSHAATPRSVVDGYAGDIPSLPSRSVGARVNHATTMVGGATDFGGDDKNRTEKSSQRLRVAFENGRISKL